MMKEKATTADNTETAQGDPATTADNTAGTGNPAPAAEAAHERKSIVPSGWKTKGDELTTFINAQCTGKDGFQWPSFFQLMRENIGGSLTEEKIAHYEGQVAAKLNGAPGRAKMTLRNMLATNVRKNGKAIGLDKTEVAITIAKPAVTGAAKAAEEKAEANKEQAAATQG